ncbi:MAG: hypothetical protein JNK64_10960 [Myxococcales bacterium]|nr:hypothetical protein [Myxococcales bacterium]
MFKKLLRDLIDTSHQPRVGFVTEPTALVASHDRREMRRVELPAWNDLAARHAGRAMSASLVGGGEDDKGSYALVLIDGAEELTVVLLPSRKERAAFIAGFVDDGAAARSLSRFDLVAARINPPPPPPPPGYPPPELLARLEAGLRVLRLPVLVASVEVHVGLDVAGRDR